MVVESITRDDTKYLALNLTVIDAHTCFYKSRIIFTANTGLKLAFSWAKSSVSL